MIGLRGQIDLAIGLAIQHTGFLVIQVLKSHLCRLCQLVFKKGFVCADHLGVLLETLSHALAQADEALHAFGGQERVAINGI